MLGGAVRSWQRWHRGIGSSLAVPLRYPRYRTVLSDVSLNFAQTLVTIIPRTSDAGKAPLPPVQDCEPQAAIPKGRPGTDC